MRRTRVRALASATVFMMMSDPALAQKKAPQDHPRTVVGSVANVDMQRRAIVKTEDGEEYWMKGETWKPGDKVRCTVKEDNLAECEKIS